MGRLLGKAVRVEHLAVQRPADRADPLVLHGHPFELPDSDLVVELESPRVPVVKESVSDLRFESATICIICG
ncbi:MAG: hypothetical protein Kow0099_38350 [Candidatus Abyssubacteria bacterium]